MSIDLREQKTALDLLRAEYDRIVVRMANGAMPAIAAAPGPSVRQLVGAIADLEYSMRSHERIKRAFAIWICIHIIAALVMYPALALHIWNGLYFGLRWLQ